MLDVFGYLLSSNYAGIIGWSLSMKTLVLFKLVLVLKFSLYLILTKILLLHFGILKILFFKCYLLQQQQIEVNRQTSIRVGLGRC